MQNQLERGGSFSAMLVSGADPCFGGPDHHHDFSGLNGSSGDYAALLSSNNNHHHHHPSHQPLSHHHPEPNNNNAPTQTNPTTGTNGTPKPKKVPPPNGKKTKGRVKIKMEFIDNKLRRYTTFSKRKTGIMKKAYELSTLTGTQVMLLVASETGHVYTFATRKLQPMITSEAGKALIQTCLNSPDPPNTGSDTQRMSATGYEETELTYAADPNGSEHGDTKDDESESGSSDGDEPKDVPSLLPLTNGLLPPNFAALFASASAAGFSGSKGGLTIGLVPGPQQQDAGQSLGSGSHRSTHHHQHHHHHGPTTSSSATSSTTTTSSTSKSIRIKREAHKQ